jgi:hypothetical protein
MLAIVHAAWDRVCLFLRANALFCLSIPLCGALLLLIPQISRVMFQLLAIGPNPPAGYLTLAIAFVAYLAVLLTGAVAAILRVAPPDVSKQPDAPPWLKAAVAAVIWPGLPGWVNVPLRLVVFVAAVAVFVLAGIAPMISLPVLLVLMLPLMCSLIDAVCGGMARATDKLFAKDNSRRRGPLLVAAAGVVVIVLTRGFRILDTPYLLADCVLSVSGVALIAFGVWYAFLARLLPEKNAGRQAVERLFAWLFVSFLLGEAVWSMANWSATSAVVSFRLYTIWAVLQAVVLVIVTAALLDTLDRETKPPWRVLGLIGLAVVSLLIGAANPEPLPEAAAPGQATRADREEWIHHLQRRIAAVPKDKAGKGQPVVIVAASGGGSRAAIFTGLVLEALAREPFAEGSASSWGDHVVLISGVSGGSLGTARYLSGPGWRDEGGARPEFLHSGRPELAERMKEKLEEMLKKIKADQDQLREEVERLRKRAERLKPAGGEEYEVADAEHREASERFQQKEAVVTAARDVEEFNARFRDFARDPESASAGQELEKLKHLSWVAHSATLDDLCTDFMAPVLRGALSPFTSRGEALRRFWAGRYNWRDSLDRTGYPAGQRGEQPYDWSRHPLAIYNSSDVRRGCRVAVGFPPLPEFFLASGLPTKPGSDAGRYPPQVLADLDPDRAMPLADAVGLSANFPFGFNVASMRRRQPDDKDYRDQGETDEQAIERRAAYQATLAEKKDLVAKILDGGIVDNTGIDSIYLAVEAIRLKARQPAREGKPNVYRQVWDELIDRRVYLIEIDSGAKPDKPGPATRLLSVLLDPLASLTNSGYLNADRDKKRYLADLESRLSLGVDHSRHLQQLTAGSELSEQEEWLRTRLLQQQISGVRRFTALTISANHYDAGNIMTAWSLGPDDKAELLERFLLELVRAKHELARLAVLSAHSAEEESAKLREAGRLAVEGAMAKRDRFLVLQSLEKLGREFDALKRRPDVPPETLLNDITRLENQINLAKLRAGKANLDDKETAKRLDELLAETAEARDAVKKGDRAATVLNKYGIRAAGQLGKLAGKLRKEQSAAIKEDQDKMESANETLKVQKDLNRGATESRNTFDRPPAAKK